MSIQNRKARFDYEILDTYEAGIVLTGEEVKAVRAGQMDLRGAYIIQSDQRSAISDQKKNKRWTGGNPIYHIRNTKYLVLFGATIHRYKYSSNKEYDPKRDRILLLSKREIVKIAQSLQTKGLSVVPLEGYFKGNLFKLKIGIGRGKKEYDKRETIKRRELERETRKRVRNA